MKREVAYYPAHTPSLKGVRAPCNFFKPPIVNSEPASGRQAVNGGLDRGKDRVSEAGRSCSDEYIGGLQICIINED